MQKQIDLENLISKNKGASKEKVKSLNSYYLDLYNNPSLINKSLSDDLNELSSIYNKIRFNEYVMDFNELFPKDMDTIKSKFMFLNFIKIIRGSDDYTCMLLNVISFSNVIFSTVFLFAGKDIVTGLLFLILSFILFFGVNVFYFNKLKRKKEELNENVETISSLEEQKKNVLEKIITKTLSDDDLLNSKVKSFFSNELKCSYINTQCVKERFDDLIKNYAETNLIVLKLKNK